MPENENPTGENEETPEAPETGTESDEDEDDGTPFDAARAKAKIAKTNSEAKSLRDRLKAAEDKVKAFEDSNKTEAEKTAERLKKAEADAAEALKLRVALDKGLTYTQAKRLVGSTVEELEADADELLESFGGKEKTPNTKVPGKPQARLKSGGSDPDEPAEETDVRKLGERMFRR
jgi:hypothetical protein